MNQICRCCLTDNPTYSYNIFQENLCTELLLCVPSVNIEPDDGLPEVICELCWLRLRDALEFRRRCEQSYCELRKRYQETSQAIDQALGLNILEQIGVHEQQHVAHIAEPVVSAGEVDVADVGVVQLLEEYTALEMTMLDELMLEDQSLTDFQEIGCRSSSRLRDVEEDPVISELLAKFLNDPAIDSTTTDSTNSLSTTDTFCLESQPPVTPTNFVTLTCSSPPAAENNAVAPKKSAKSTVAKTLHPCPQCEKKFTRNFQLKLHLISVHGVGDGLQYTCLECSKTFASRHSLNYHQKALHSMERPFICPHCERRFVLSTQLSSHLRTHTGEAKPRIFQCSSCEKSWPTKSDLKTHMRSHDPHLERRYKCMRCPKSFFTLGHLNSHELVHTGEKPYRCALCEKAYQNIGNLNNHIFRSHGEVLMGKQLSPYAFGNNATTQCDA